VAFFGGVAPYVVIDNLKSGVRAAHRYDPDVNPPQPARCAQGRLVQRASRQRQEAHL